MNHPEKSIGYKVDKSTIISLEKGKIPPQAIDLEMAVLGACLSFKYAISEAVEILQDKSEVFYKDAHKHIYQTLIEMFNENQEIDLLTASQQLKSKNKLELVGGDYYLIELSRSVSDSAHIDFHCRILMQKYVQRESIKVASQIIENAYEESVEIFDLLDTSQRSLDETSKWLLKKKPDNIKDIYKNIITKKTAIEVGIPSKFSKINKRTNGYHNTDLHIIAGRPGMGKTAFVINEAKSQAEKGIPVGFLSLEMSTTQLIGRMIAIEFGIESSKIKYGQLTDSEREILEREAKKIDELPLHILDQPSLSIMLAKTTIGTWVRQDKVKIVYIDYLQLMTVGSTNTYGNREQEISYISRSLKAIAKEFDIPIVALSQLSRAVETRGGSKRPQLSDLRESGAIEQDADVVQFIYRPEYYKIEQWDDDERTPTANQCEIITEKSREGELGATVISTDLKYMRMMDLAESWEPMHPDNKSIPATSPKDAFEAAKIGDVADFGEEDDELPF